MKRQSPFKALQVAQLRCDAAVTITITGKAGSGKSTAAEIIAQALGNRGYTASVIESDDSIYHSSPNKGQQSVKDRDDRLYLVAVEDSKIGYAPKEPTPEPAKETPCSDCTGCEEDEEGDLPPIIKAILVHAMLKAKRQGM